MVLDATCPNIFAQSYRSQATSAAGCVATQTEERKALNHSHLLPDYLFTTAAAIETSGDIGHLS